MLRGLVCDRDGWLVLLGLSVSIRVIMFKAVRTEYLFKGFWLM